MGEELRVTVVATGLDRPAGDLHPGAAPAQDPGAIPGLIQTNAPAAAVAAAPQATVVTAPPMQASAPKTNYDTSAPSVSPATTSEPDVWGSSPSGSDAGFSMANVPSILRNK